MPAHLKAFVVVLVLGLGMLHVLGRLLTPEIMSREDFARRRKAWLLITAAAFLSGNFWIYAAACILIARYASKGEDNPLALFCFVLFAVPSFSKDLRLGSMLLFQVEHLKFLGLTLLVPLAARLYRERGTRPRGPVGIDVLVGAYVAYQLLAVLLQQPFTATVRMAGALFFDVVLLYYVTSRSLTTLQRFRDVVAAIIAAVAITAAVAVVETGKAWWVYDSLRGPFGFPGGGYISRGMLRAKAAMGHPIVLGYAVGVTLMLLHAIYRSLPRGNLRLLALGTLLAGLFAPFSRGPWVGTAGGAAVLTLTGPGKGKRFGYALVALVLASLLMAVTPVGQDVYRMLPFIHENGTDAGSVVYRQNLWDASIIVLKQNLWFGDLEYLSNPLMEKMRQGEGIIDMVNTYLQFAMSFGVLGLALFVLVLLGSWSALSHPGGSGRENSPELHDMQRGLRSALLVTALTIATCSYIEYVPAVMWLIIGLSAGFARITSTAATPAVVAGPAGFARRQRIHAPAAATAKPPASPTGQASHGSNSPRRLPIPRRALKK